MWINGKFFKYIIGIILVLVAIFLVGNLNFFFAPIKKLIAVLFFPILLSGLLYYLLRPLVRLVEKTRANRTLAIIIIYIIVISLLVLAGNYAGSLISKQFNQFSSDLPGIISAGQNKAAEIINDNNLGSFFTSKTQEQIASTLENIVPQITGSIFNAISTVTGIVTILIMVPFILFYFLKDDHLFAERIINLIPKKYKSDASAIMEETDKTLSTYIIGQAIIASILGLLMYIGYLIIDIKYPLILALFALLTFFIPMFGSFIGIIPAMLIGLSTSPIMVLKVVLLMIIVQQLEGNLVSPFLVGKRLKIHPLTLILLFLVAASFYGFVGMLISVPTYAVLKVLVKNGIRLYHLKFPKSNLSLNK